MVAEHLLRYWREDILLNEHHEHWHLVYPYEGRPLPIDSLLTEDSITNDLNFADEASRTLHLHWDKRHGELFAYMHAQMLARYSAERLSLGLPPVRPLENYRQIIEDGYDPGTGTIMKYSGDEVQVSVRPDNVRLSDVTRGAFSQQPGSKLDNVEAFRDRLYALAESKGHNVDIAGLAERVEATDRLATSYYGSLHNSMHQLIALHNNDPSRPGVMYWEASAIRDPVFFCLHSHIDSFFSRYVDVRALQKFDDLPSVNLISIFVTGSTGENGVIHTEINSFIFSAPFGATRRVKFLSHEDFRYTLSIYSEEHDGAVTVRIFMAPEATLDDRRSWIEMDKFSTDLISGVFFTVVRESRASSVVRRPVITADMIMGAEVMPDDRRTSPGCKCGWPYTLLVPRGKPDGMEMRVMAIVTAGTDFSRSASQAAGTSYCGVRDREYPDRREMGYPFNREFSTSIREFLDGDKTIPQVASATIHVINRE